jgi:hypothetical protein
MLAGPAAAQLLADQGADVIEVENCGNGDPQRGDNGSKISSPIFTTINRNRRSLAVDLKTVEGITALKQLVATADIFLHNFRPGAVDRLGIGYEEMKAVKSNLIYVSSSGFGQVGHLTKGRVHGPVVQAASGLTSTQADANDRPRMLYNRISLIPQTSTTRLPLVGSGGSLVVESRKNGQTFRGIIWWGYLVGSSEFSRPPARPPARGRPNPRAAPRHRQRPHPAPHRGAPFAARSLFPCRRSTDRNPFS